MGKVKCFGCNTGKNKYKECIIEHIVGDLKSGN